MTLKIIELNDRAVRVADESGLLLSSPGFALAEDKSLLVGEEAERQARLKPTSSFNKFWNQLSLEPLATAANVRHHADLAHAHLLHIAEAASIDHDVIFAVPGNFSREQLSILLGLAAHSPIKPVGVVDSALAATLAVSAAETVIYADLQLHQVVLTRLLQKDGVLRSDSVIQIPGVGSQDLMRLMMQLATRLFIDQSRFNPQHNAASEQQLYNALPAWLAQDASEGNLRLELRSGETLYTAKMPRDSLVSTLGELYRKIDQQIGALAEQRPVQLVLAEDLAALPGLRAALSLHDVITRGPDETLLTGLRQRDHIVAGDSGIHLVSALPIASSRAPGPQVAANSPAAEPPGPTHALFNNEAYPLQGLTLSNQGGADGQPQGAPGLVLSVNGLPARLGVIESRTDGYYLTQPAKEVQVNAQACGEARRLSVGDRVHFTGSDVSIHLIRVNHG